MYRTNWKDEAIKQLINQRNYDKKTAEWIFNKVYRKVSKQTLTNRRFQTYNALFYRYSDFKAVISDDYEIMFYGEIDDKKEILRRFNGMANHYEEVNKILEDYKKGILDTREFLSAVRNFKKSNNYKREHSKGST